MPITTRTNADAKGPFYIATLYGPISRRHPRLQDYVTTSHAFTHFHSPYCIAK